ncbi:TIR domain-containing protein [Pararobbsia silviterrae]|nr:TIR domain-containing protein [Pararobbsia silviterrae]
MHTAIQLIFDPQHDTHRAQEVERVWRMKTGGGDGTQTQGALGLRHSDDKVLVLLNGPHTASQRWIQFEVMRAFIRGTPIVVVDVSCLRDERKLRAMRGRNPLDLLSAEAEAQTLWLKEFNPVTLKWQAARASSSVPRYAVPYPMDGNGPWLLSSIFPIYRWTEDWGERNLLAWIDEALSATQSAAQDAPPALVAAAASSPARFAVA